MKTRSLLNMSNRRYLPLTQNDLIDNSEEDPEEEYVKWQPSYKKL